MLQIINYFKQFFNQNMYMSKDIKLIKSDICTFKKDFCLK